MKKRSWITFLKTLKFKAGKPRWLSLVTNFILLKGAYVWCLWKCAAQISFSGTYHSEESWLTNLTALVLATHSHVNMVHILNMVRVLGSDHFYLTGNSLTGKFASRNTVLADLHSEVVPRHFLLSLSQLSDLYYNVNALPAYCCYLPLHSLQNFS